MTIRSLLKVSLVALATLTVQQSVFSKVEPFNESKLKSTEFVVLKFTAPWCGPCRQIKPTYEKLSQDQTFNDVIFMEVDIDVHKKVASQYNIKSIPAMLIFNKGKVVCRLEQRTLAGLKNEISSIKRNFKANNQPKKSTTSHKKTNHKK